MRRLAIGMLLAGMSVSGLGAISSQGAAEDEWPEAGHDVAGTYHSPLVEINRSNVTRLGFAWDYRLGTHRGLEASPLEVDGVLYFSGNFGRFYALDAATGRELWTYTPELAPKAGRHACCDAVNRGVVVRDGRVYVAALDGFMHAIDARTGRRIWKTDTVPARAAGAPITLTGAPVIAGQLVVIGTAGGDFAGTRGYVVALDRETGQVQWRFYTVPRDPRLGPQDQPHLVSAVQGWDPRHRWEAGGGGAV